MKSFAFTTFFIIATTAAFSRFAPIPDGDGDIEEMSPAVSLVGANDRSGHRNIMADLIRVGHIESWSEEFRGH